MTTLRTDSTHSGITIDYADGSGFVHGGSGPLTVYSDDEKAAINALTDADDDTYYLFLVNSVTKLDADGNNTVVSGYMPVGYQHGFIFEQFDVARTYAHELSHGAFALHHTFSANTESFRATEGTTNNLMDYAEGVTLNHKQWTWMHENHGKGLFGFLADESEGEWTTDGHYYLFTYLGMLMGMDYATAEQYGKWAEEPDTRVISEGNMQENITWLIGGLQQRNHALTGGFHGVELAATAYAITHYYNTKPQAVSMYLLHRFGDVFAHYNIEQDIDDYGTIPLKDYCSKIESYFSSKLDGINFIKPNIDYLISSGKVIRLSNNDVYTEGDDVYTSMTKEEVIWQMLLSIFRAADNPLILRLDPDIITNAFTLDRWNSYAYSVMKEEILKVLPNANQNDFIMYGKDSGAKCLTFFSFTTGHAGKKNTNADNILARIPLFKYYVRNAVELFKVLQDSGYIQKGDNVITDSVYADICGLVDAAEKAANGDVSLKLDGIWAFHIYLKRLEKGENIKSFVLPVKYLTSETRQLDYTVPLIYRYKFNWDRTNEDWRDIDGAANIRTFLSRYLEYCRQSDIYKFNNIKAFDMTDDGTCFTIKPITK